MSFRPVPQTTLDSSHDILTCLRACVPGRKQRKAPIRYSKRRFKRRDRIEITFGRLKNRRRVATRYDRCPKVCLSAIELAATVSYWL